MGTAITSDDFVLSYVQNHVATKRASLIVWFIGLITLFAFTGLSIARMVMFPGLWSRMIRHPIEPLYLACVPMSMIPLTNGMRFVSSLLSLMTAKLFSQLWNLFLESLHSFRTSMALLHLGSLADCHSHWLCDLLSRIPSNEGGG